ncbi:hypothetical protein QOL99_00125 [Deinococcus sp. MIMF12]|uniref:CRIB domain-containing protein n=1 Tax=Deinococcus rhizophilus TaxID=3049544 RepID=A0ABT7JBX3_9DEIO|nr:hypothetical protein [Deinococcus rhizophilus]MDL2342554.1 hypothetical protein [Deinococcus rhizophilus]
MALNIPPGTKLKDRVMPTVPAKEDIPEYLDRARESNLNDQEVRHTNVIGSIITDRATWTTYRVDGQPPYGTPGTLDNYTLTPWPDGAEIAALEARIVALEALLLAGPPQAGVDAISTGRRASDGVVREYRFAPVTLTSGMTLTGVALTVTTAHPAQFMEVSVYNAAGQRVTTTERREIVTAGAVTLALRPVAVAGGEYYAMIASTSPTAQFGLTGNLEGLALPLLESGVLTSPTNFTHTIDVGTMPADSIQEYYLAAVNGAGQETTWVQREVTWGTPYQVQLSWDAVAGATGYRIYKHSAALNGFGLWGTTEAGTTTILDDGTVAPLAPAVPIGYQNGTAGRGVPLSPESVDLSRAALGKAPPALTLYGKRTPKMTVPVKHEQIGQGFKEVWVYGEDPVSQQPYGWRTNAGRICRSTDSGITWENLMLLPPPVANQVTSPSDMLVHAGRLYVLMANFDLWRTSDLTANATWQNISCPVGDALRHPNAVARPLALAIFGNRVYLGEYSHMPNELTRAGGRQGSKCRVLSLNLDTMVWKVSGEFDARHAHSGKVMGTAALWWTFGDAGYGPDVGVSYLPVEGLRPDGQRDAWVRDTLYGLEGETGHSDHYPIAIGAILPEDVTSGGVRVPAGLYMESDRVGIHVLMVGWAGITGQFSIDALVFPDVLRPGETVAGLVMDARRNLYYLTQENDKNRWYVCPPPYTQTIPFYEHVDNRMYIGRAVVSGNAVLVHGHRVEFARFEGQ